MPIYIPSVESLLRLRRGWTRQEYERLTELGIFGPDERLELIEGEIVEKIPQNSPHASSITLSTDALRLIVPQGYHLRIQLPLAVGDRSETEPDIAVVPGSARDYEVAHPMTAALIVEVADSSLPLDRTVKAGMYARALIAEYWIVNLHDRQLEVHRQPSPTRNGHRNYTYHLITTHDEHETVSTLLAPNTVIAVSDLLPRKRS